MRGLGRGLREIMGGLTIPSSALVHRLAATWSCFRLLQVKGRAPFCFRAFVPAVPLPGNATPPSADECDSCSRRRLTCSGKLPAHLCPRQSPLSALYVLLLFHSSSSPAFSLPLPLCSSQLKPTSQSSLQSSLNPHTLPDSLETGLGHPLCS